MMYTKKSTSVCGFGLRSIKMLLYFCSNIHAVYGGDQLSSPLSLGSPNYMVQNYALALQRSVIRALDETDEKIQKQEVAIVVFMAVTVVEAFINAYFRVLVSEDGFKPFEHQIIKDLDKRISLAQKIKQWPRLAFGRSIDESKGIGLEFKKLRDLRNKLMHFQSSHENFSYEKFTFHGVADISSYATLSAEWAMWAMETAEGIIEEILRLRGSSEKQRVHDMHFWIARLPEI